jgi:uncharacterized protein
MPKKLIAWVDIPVSDFERAQKFYHTIYNLELSNASTSARPGLLIVDDSGSGIGAAMAQGTGYIPATRVYLNAGADLNEVLDRVQEAGGKIVLPKFLISPEEGYFAIIEDTEGNHISLHSNG